jgi:lipopolysaccharide biosynthesis protein
VTAVPVTAAPVTSAVRGGVTPPVRSVAFYLPQFHPIPENDEWWGTGFTEWTNVARARPRFRGHEQPHLPADLGFYDLRLPEVRSAQAAMARAFGVDAFCYYHYWFEGRRLLERPFAEVLRSGEPDFPFLLCWANEPWSRAWDGAERRVLMPQRYSDEDDRRHIRSLFEAFADPRYVRVDGRPVFLVYRASLLPDPRRTTDTWRQAAARAGVGELFLARVESMRPEHGDPRRLGFDAAVEFQPNWSVARAALWRKGLRWAGSRLHLWPDKPRMFRFPYDDLVDRTLAQPAPAYPRFPCVTPRWDNSARRRRGAVVIEGATPARYEHWLRETARRNPSGLVFVNAWNEWGEGAHLEPCQRWGTAWLEAHARVMAEAGASGLAVRAAGGRS